MFNSNCLQSNPRHFEQLLINFPFSLSSKKTIKSFTLSTCNFDFPHDLRHNHPNPALVNILLRFICTNISNSQQTVACAEERAYILDEANKSISAIPATSFKIIENSPLYFDSELRSCITEISHPLQSTIVFPASRNRKAEVAIELLPATLASVKAVHAGLASAEIVGTLPRSGVDPLCLESGGFVVRPSQAIASTAR